MEIRELAENELDKLLSLYSHLHAFDDPLPEAAVVAGVWRDIRKNPLLKYFGVFLGGELVSACTLTVIPNLTRGCRSYGIIEYVVTHGDFRRKGYGRALLHHALAYAWSRNCYKVVLTTGRKDEGICRFYGAAGFDGHAKQAFVARPA